MRNGRYTMTFSCDGYRGSGHLDLDGLFARGRDERISVEGQISEAGRHLIGALTIDLAPGVSGNPRIQGLFACAMSGNASPDRFELYGVGPLGLIIEITAQWAGSVDDRVGDRRVADRQDDR